MIAAAAYLLQLFGCKYKSNYSVAQIFFYGEGSGGMPARLAGYIEYLKQCVISLVDDYSLDGYAAGA